MIDIKKKIVFVTARFVPSGCGVTDYVMRLSEDLITLGHECVVIATAQNLPPDEKVRSLQVGAVRAFAFNADLFKGDDLVALLESLTPFVVSFQFGGFYGYHRKGIPSLHVFRVFRAVARHRLHIMFHEIWLEPRSQASLTRKTIGHLQRFSLKRLMTIPGQRVVHTHIAEYQGKLKGIGVKANLLPLFGNIPITKARTDWGKTALKNSEAIVRYGLFGSIHPDCDLCPFLAAVARWSELNGKHALIATIGLTGEPGTKNLILAASRYPKYISLLQLGPQPPENISDFLQEIDFGVTTTAWGRCGKSGTVAAMLDHGLPVIAVQPPPSGGPEYGEITSPLLYRFIPGETPGWFVMKRRAPVDSVSGVARRFQAEVLGLSALGSVT